MIGHTVTGISLLVISGKTFASLILSSLMAIRDRRMSNHAELRPGPDCVGQIFTLRLVLQQHFKYLQPTVTCL